MVESNTDVVRRLSNELVRGFLTLQREGFCQASSIGLYGGQVESMEMLAGEMRALLSEIERSDVRVEVHTAQPSGAGLRYCIDVGYFVRHLEMLNAA